MSWTAERARIASLSRSRTPDDPDLLAAYRALALERVQEKVAAAVGGAPPLPAAVADRLVELIRSAPVAADQAEPEPAAAPVRRPARGAVRRPDRGTVARPADSQRRAA
jgi:hypothetical protein